MASGRRAGEHGDARGRAESGGPHGHRGGRWSGGKPKMARQMLGEEPRGPVGGRRIQNGRGAAPVRAGNPNGSGGGRGSGGESQGLRGRAKVGREHQGHLRRAGDPRSTWGGRGERIVGRSWVAGGGGGEGNTYRQNSNAVKESFWDSQGVRLRRGDSWTELEVAEVLGGR